MPTINRPRTNLERLKALQAAKAKADVTSATDLAFSAETLTRLTAFLPTFQTEMQEVGSALSAQSAATVTANAAKAAARMHISHFFQVFNLGIQRGIYSAQQRAHFNLDVNSADLPRLVTEQEIATWGQRIVTGDAARTAVGGAAMSNPTAAEVATVHSAYIAAQSTQSTLKDAYDHEQEDVQALETEADDLIADIWDEVEFTFRKDSPPSKRRKAREYGVRYIPNPGEAPSPEDYSIMGTVTNNVTGNPVAGVLVLLNGTDVYTATDEHGKYLIPVQPEGTYNLTFYKNAYELHTASDIAVTATAIATVNAALHPAAPTGTLTGRVTRAGTGSNATVSIDGYPISVNTNADGYYTIPDAPSGNRTIRAYITDAPSNQQTQTVTIPQGDTLTVDFTF
ncbi:MAG: carboxypeptidase regulatory-like domain-containing protein [Chitinophagales bacterium]|nr:carboxypeptidase regulatory-like domain-containing protein [Chitinophagales bacterium]